MKLGTTIQNSDMTHTLVAFKGTDDKNVVFLVSENGCGGCRGVTALGFNPGKKRKYFFFF